MPEFRKISPEVKTTKIKHSEGEVVDLAELLETRCPFCQAKYDAASAIVVNGRYYLDCPKCNRRRRITVHKEMKDDRELFVPLPESRTPLITEPSDVPCPVCGTKMLFADNKARLVCPQCARNKLERVAVNPEVFPSGAVRDNENTPSYSLIPPESLKRLAEIYRVGEQHYPNRNWRKGIPVSNIIDHAMEHLMKWLEGNRDDDHLAKVAWAMFTLMFYEAHGLLDDDIKWSGSH